jgi:hypothetical protein
MFRFSGDDALGLNILAIRPVWQADALDCLVVVANQIACFRSPTSWLIVVVGLGAVGGWGR